MEIEVSTFGNFSTDTGSTDCNQVNINVFRFWRSRPSVPHGANFYLDRFQLLSLCAVNQVMPNRGSIFQNWADN